MTFTHKLSFRPDTSKPILPQVEEWLNRLEWREWSEEKREELLYPLLAEAHANFHQRLIEEIEEENAKETSYLRD